MTRTVACSLDRWLCAHAKPLSCVSNWLECARHQICPVKCRPLYVVRVMASKLSDNKVGVLTRTTHLTVQQEQTSEHNQVLVQGTQATQVRCCAPLQPVAGADGSVGSLEHAALRIILPLLGHAAVVLVVPRVAVARLRSQG